MCTEDLGEACVFVDTDGHVDGGGGDELGRPGCDGVVGFIAIGGRERVDCVGCEVGRGVEGVD